MRLHANEAIHHRAAPLSADETDWPTAHCHSHPCVPAGLGRLWLGLDGRGEPGALTPLQVVRHESRWKVAGGPLRCAGGMPDSDSRSDQAAAAPARPAPHGELAGGMIDVTRAFEMSAPRKRSLESVFPRRCRCLPIRQRVRSKSQRLECQSPAPAHRVALMLRELWPLRRTGTAMARRYRSLGKHAVSSNTPRTSSPCTIHASTHRNTIQLADLAKWLEVLGCAGPIQPSGSAGRRNPGSYD